MNIFITGGTGFIGKALCERLFACGHRLTLLVRSSSKRLNLPLTYLTDLNQLASFDGFDAVINLAGEPIFDHRWSASQKARLTESRLNLTTQIVEKIRQSHTPPAVFLSGSATGFYGEVSGQFADENSEVGGDFAAQLCWQWEQAAMAAQAYSRVCLLRTGLVLSPKGGMLARILPLYRLGLGGKLGSGKQHWAWISLQDQINAILFLLNHSDCEGAFNLVSPTPISQEQFNQQLAAAVKRPACLATPAWLLHLTLGERASLLLNNQPILPTRLLQHGFVFETTDLTACFTPAR